MIENRISNKSVAIIGRSEYLNDLAQGEFIDSHDEVIRAHSNLPYPSEKFVLDFDNDESFVPRDYHHALGKKTTGFAPANLPYWALGYCDETIPKLQDRGCEYLIQHKMYNVTWPQELAVMDYIQDKFGIPVYITPYDQLLTLFRTFDYTFPMPGTILIDFIAAHKPSRLYCTGFACYQDSDDAWLKSEVKLTRDHKTLYDLRMLRDLVAQNDSISVDDKMTNYFSHV